MVTVRPAALEDVPAMGGLWATLVRYSPPPGRRWRYREGAREIWMEHIGRSLEEGGDFVALVAEAEAQIVGYATARIKEKPPIYLHPRVLVYGTVSVAVGRQGHGVGRALMEEVLAWGRRRGASSAQITTSWHNVTARAAWKSMGFEEAMLTMTRDLGAEG